MRLVKPNIHYITNPQQILITGGAGFLGSHLCDRLIQNGHYVICADNYFTGSPENIAHLINNPRFEALRHDVTLPLHIEVNQIFNLACPASPIQYKLDPIQTTKTSVLGAINMLDLAKRVKARILQASTSEVYGDPEVHPQKESYYGHVNPIGPRACYDEGKRCAETLFFDYHRQHGVSIKVCRIFNTYGPRMGHADGRVVSSFVTQALTNEPIKIFGDGDQTRAFCYVDDMIDGLTKLMDSDEKLSGPVNLGNPVEVSIRSLAEIIVDLTGSRSKIEHVALTTDDPKRRQPSIERANDELCWSPKIDLRTGLRRTIEYFEDECRLNAISKMKVL